MRLLILSLLIVFFFSCEKENTGGGEPVEIYLLKNTQTVPGKCQVDPSSSTIEDHPAIFNHEILEYSQATFEFKLSDNGYNKIQTLSDRTPFAVVVGKQVIYYGFYKPSHSSSSCDHSITMSRAFSSENKIAMRLGYPGPLQGVTIDDQRNNEKLLDALRAQGKLR